MMKTFSINSPVLLKLSKVGLSILRNRYSATALIGLFWVMFISDVDLIFIAKENAKLQEMRKEVENTQLKNNELR